MRLSDVINRFALVSGLEPAEVSKWTPLCIDAMNEVGAMAKKNIPESPQNSLRLSNCAGVLAFYKYSMYIGGDVKSFSAGSVSISTENNEAVRAKNLWEAERSSASDLLSDSDFYFGRVRV